MSLLHDGGVVHGDLTTSNMVLREADGKLVSKTPPLWHAHSQPSSLSCASSPALCGPLTLRKASNLAAPPPPLDVMLTTSPNAATPSPARCSPQVLIDFGLSSNSTLPEDKAVDLYVLERAIASAHAADTGLFEAIVEEYRASSRYWNPVLNKFAEGACNRDCLVIA